MKNPLTPDGIEPATFRIVAQHLTHCTTAVPERQQYLTIIFGFAFQDVITVQSRGKLTPMQDAK